jgi:integrase
VIAAVQTINLSLEKVRRILRLAGHEWRDEQGLTWLESAPKIKLLRVTDARKPYPLSKDEQRLLFSQLPDHLLRMALFKVYTGCRQEEMCSLRWEWERKVPELDT